MYRIIHGDQQVVVFTLWYPFYYFVFFLTPTSQLSPLSILADRRRYCCGPPLKYRVQYSRQDTFAATAILNLVYWLGRLFCCRYFSWYRYVSIKSITAVPPSGTLSMLSHPFFLILSSRVSNTAVLIVLHICFHTYTPLYSSSHISFLVPIFSPLL